MDDVERIRSALSGVQSASREGRRPGTTPWLVKTQVGWAREIPTVNLGLLGGARLSRRVVREMGQMADQIETGAVAFTTGGGGKGSLGPRSPVGIAVREELIKLCEAHETWTFVATGHTQYTLIIDVSKAPPTATNELGPLFYVLSTGFGVAVVLAVLQMLGVFG